MNKKQFKKSPEELQEYLKFKRRSYTVPNKKGKGSYKRSKNPKNWQCNAAKGRFQARRTQRTL